MLPRLSKVLGTVHFPRRQPKGAQYPTTPSECTESEIGLYTDSSRRLGNQVKATEQLWMDVDYPYGNTAIATYKFQYRSRSEYVHHGVWSPFLTTRQEISRSKASSHAHPLRFPRSRSKTVIRTTSLPMRHANNFAFCAPVTLQASSSRKASARTLSVSAPSRWVKRMTTRRTLKMGMTTRSPSRPSGTDASAQEPVLKVQRWSISPRIDLHGL